VTRDPWLDPDAETWLANITPDHSLADEVLADCKRLGCTCTPEIVDEGKRGILVTHAEDCALVESETP
jgi:hypothetical protein